MIRSGDSNCVAIGYCCHGDTGHMAGGGGGGGKAKL